MSDVIEKAKEAGLWEQRDGVWMAIGGEVELSRFAELLRRTQPEATAPAQDLSAAILAITANKRAADHLKMREFNGYLEGFAEARNKAAALASSANALIAGDSEDTQFLSWVKAHRQSWLVEYRRRTPESYRAAILQSQKAK